MNKKISRVEKLAADIAARGGHIDGNGSLVIPMKGEQKLTGFDGSELKATTPATIQEAADYYFLKKFEMENRKEALEKATEKLEAEVAASGLKSVVVKDSEGMPFTVRIKQSKKLEVKKI